MNQLLTKKLMKLNLIALLVILLLMTTIACNWSAESKTELVEGILRNVDSANGEITIVTKDGKTLVLKINTDTLVETEGATLETLEPDTSVEVEFDDDKQLAQRIDAQPVIEKKESGEEEAPHNTIDILTILPRLESIEDVFHTLGVREKALMLHEKGLTWAHVARELGYGPDSMHLRLQDIAEERLKTAIHSGSLTSDQAEELLARFDHLAAEWVEEIFADAK